MAFCIDIDKYISEKLAHLMFGTKDMPLCLPLPENFYWKYL
jgi:hypothetical protein